MRLKERHKLASGVVNVAPVRSSVLRKRLLIKSADALNLTWSRSVSLSNVLLVKCMKGDGWCSVVQRLCNCTDSLESGPDTFIEGRKFHEGGTRTLIL